MTISADTNNDGTGDVAVFTINSGVVTLSHLTIADGFGSDGLGGGIHTSFGNTVTVVPVNETESLAQRAFLPLVLK